MMVAAERDMILAWLESGHATLWGRAFDINQDPTPAAAWFYEQMMSFHDFAEKEMRRRGRGHKRHLAPAYQRQSYDVV